MPLPKSPIIVCTKFGAIHEISISQYPDGLPLIRRPVPTAIERVLLRPTSLSDFVAAMFWIDAYTQRGRAVPHLILPFVPGARQDRLNDGGDYLFTAKSVANMINARNFPSVTAVDPHSDVTPALIDRCRVVHVSDFVKVPAGKYAAVISPDAGAEKRASAVARKLGVPLLHAWKTRHVDTGQITGFGVEPFPLALGDSPRLLVVDDICDGGGTFIGLADICQAETAGSVDLHLFVTHGVFSKGTDELKKYYSHIYCTDSIIGDRPGVFEIDVCRQLVEGSL